MDPVSAARTANTPQTIEEGGVPGGLHGPHGEPVNLMPECDGDVFTLLAKLDVKQSQQNRKANQASADSYAAAEDAADAKRVDAMKEKATMNFAAGMAGGLTQIGSGLADMAGGTQAAGRSEQAAKAVSQTSTGISNGIGGAGKMIEAGFKHAADDADIDATRAESEGKVAKRAFDRLDKELEAAKAHEGKVMQLLQEIKQAQAQCERAALMRLA
jgi:hypothetical protein